MENWVRRIIVAVSAGIVWAIALLLAVANFDQRMTGDGSQVIVSLRRAVQVIHVSERASQLWALLFLLGVTGLVWLLFGGIGLGFAYSNTKKIAPGIRIPVSAGQGQHGTAHFLPRWKFSQVWSCARIDLHDEGMEKLLEQAESEKKQ